MENEAAQTRVIGDLNHVAEGFPVHALQAARLGLAGSVIERTVEALGFRERHGANHVAVHDRER